MKNKEMKLLHLSTSDILPLQSSGRIINGLIIEVKYENSQIAYMLSNTLNALGANSLVHYSRTDHSHENRLVAIQAKSFGGDKVRIDLNPDCDFNNIDKISSILGCSVGQKLIFTFPSAFSTVANLELLEDSQGSVVHLNDSTLSSAAAASSASDGSFEQNNNHDNFSSAYLEDDPQVSAAAEPSLPSILSTLSFFQKKVVPPITLISTLTKKFKCLFNNQYKSKTDLVVEFASEKDGFEFAQDLSKLGIVNARGEQKAVGSLRDSEGIDHDFTVIMSLANMNALLDSQVQTLGLDEFKPYASDQDLILSQF